MIELLDIPTEHYHAFLRAVTENRLSTDPDKENYYGNFEYTGASLQGWGDQFKHKIYKYYLKACHYEKT